jgi:arabinogalactan endo-1,4-beta-galactosidase
MIAAQLNSRIIMLAVLSLIFLSACNKNNDTNDPDPDTEEILPPYSVDEFVMGVDLSYLNQILDKGGQYADGKDPYQLFAEMGNNLVRLRLWNNPSWIRDVYNNPEEKLFSGYEDVEEAARKAQENNMELCIDFHYSDTWADPGKQITPAAWENLSLDILKDSLYNFTYTTLAKLKEADIIPAFVQIGNEINPGMLHPVGHYETNNWQNLGELINAGIQAVKDLYTDENRPDIILHIAQPENIRWFFNGLTFSGGVSDFDVIGVSYYPIWSEVDIADLDGYIKTAVSDFDKEVMIMETAFPWTNSGADNYHNIFGTADSIMGFEISPQGQLEYMKTLCQEIIDGGGKGVVYWEPGWISSNMITQWGTGSAWENCSFFNFQDNNSILPVVEYINFEYEFEPQQK